MRITLNLDGTPVISQTHTHPSHSPTSRLITSSLSLGVPVPLGTVYVSHVDRQVLSFSLSSPYTPTLIYKSSIYLSFYCVIINSLFTSRTLLWRGVREEGGTETEGGTRTSEKWKTLTRNLQISDLIKRCRHTDRKTSYLQQHMICLFTQIMNTCTVSGPR